ncbi:transposase [bacterium (Candidatus Blackallbacteria) CG17_big_fil_post_rev_8_21_14_2_50_48_46]|uniref:Transposase n=1 Tax=bacterium (Candidatus Blackallbacteria) CG17_big_fil_post_rev_8_21_14_2_50_48_46 TaxID=2014261 RepID=A0A2M7G890_9BACT|nr:MAG: transposase [bacterium (Candidatus Blackallbacteria) CG18_big_fil_WC_8_21_14_2_50_49_26]PIW18306.1 MAG: transposase [bacterium (Candidatus Blackallbacteria) CG17_big_fil_post_rev_8_21_14_2_50_48_46]PIW49530.1 MAG: transposase [bacterium (Candidatus Blackallbacteria) CG13_big_fil_rev_8_21_14_2_50_49_14]
MKPYSEDLRIRVLQAYLSKQGSMRNIAERFDVSLSFVLALVKQYRESGNIQPRPRGGGQKLRVDEGGMDQLSQIIQDHPKATLQELCEYFAQVTGIQLSVPTMSRCFKRLQNKHARKLTPRKRGRPPKAKDSETKETD